jgi:hypothetical protein
MPLAYMNRGAAMTRKIFTDECGRRALGVVPVAPSVLPTVQEQEGSAGSLPVRDAGRSIETLRVEAPGWALSWIDVTAEELSREPAPITAVAAAWQRGAHAGGAR